MVSGNTYVVRPQVAQASILASINKAVEDANIDFVIIVGEVTLGATTEQFEAVKHVMDNSPVPVYVTASNHDLVYANGDWKSGEHDDYARFRKTLKTETEYTISKGRSIFVMQSHTGSVGQDFTNEALAKTEKDLSYDFVYHVIEASLGTGINRGLSQSLESTEGARRLSIPSSRVAMLRLSRSSTKGLTKRMTI